MSEPHRPTATYRGSGSAARKVTSSRLGSSASSSNAGNDLDDSEEQTASTKHARDSQSELAADAQGGDTSDGDDCASMDECIDSMVAQRDRLRKRFKEWADDMSHCAKKMRCVTDNALVNQSTRLEQILSDGKARVDGIAEDQTRIREQLASFVSMLSNAQTQIFGDPRLVPSIPSTKHQFVRDSLHG
ncbi:hypothetical protein IWW47_001830 [Coemansia sp. RSA 2052]|nr:hypothetical protein IWW47_001830 [Coemansia sp. RSA 2052]